MEVTITPGLLHGSVAAIPSKSQAHRLLICSAFADQPTNLYCPCINRDIQATVQCLQALGAEITRTETGFQVTPIKAVPKSADLDCSESGSTLRFFLPIAGALGVHALFHMSGRLPLRPLSPMWEEMERMGCILSRPGSTTIECRGQLKAGSYSIRGDVSSQFITGLLLGLSLLHKTSTLAVTGTIESLPYIRMTLSALNTFQVTVSEENHIFSVIPQKFLSPIHLDVEGDWSNAAFWLAAESMGSPLSISGLHEDSPQGDRKIVSFLKNLTEFSVIDCAQTPDLVPILAVVAGQKCGARFINAARLRLKETDRLLTTADMINHLGGSASIENDELVINKTGYSGGTVDATGDHRIAMAAAIAATVCKNPVTVIGAEEVRKSYPRFWEDYCHLGGKL